MLKINTKERKYQTKFTNVNSFVNVCSERTQQVLHVSSSANKINLMLMDGENVLAYLRRNSIFGLTNSFCEFYGLMHYEKVSNTFPSTVQIPKFYLISWCEYFVEMYSFRWVSGDIPQKKTF